MTKEEHIKIVLGAIKRTLKSVGHTKEESQKIRRAAYKDMVNYISDD